MRRLYAFILMGLTTLAFIVGVAPFINEEKNLGFNYYGGFEVLYQVDVEEESEFDIKDVTESFNNGIDRKLKINNIPNYFSEVEGNSFVRVSVATSSSLEMDNLLEKIETQSEISFRDAENNLLASGSELLEVGGASVPEVTDSYGNYYVEMKIEDVDLLEQITTQLSESEESKELVIWLDYEEGDSFEDLEFDPIIQSKVLYNAEVSQPLTDTGISMSGFQTENEAKNLVSVVNSTTYDFEVNYEQIEQVLANEGENNFDGVMYAFLGSFILLLAIFVLFYRRAGIVSFVSIIFSGAVSLLIFNFLNATMSVSSLIGFLVGFLIMIDSLIVIFERVKKEFNSRKTVNKAYLNGFKKALSGISDSNIIIFIAGIVIYLFGANLLKDFSLLLTIQVAVGFISIITINHFLLNVISKTKLIKSKFCFGGDKKEEVKEEKVKEKTRINIFSLSNKFLFFSGVVAILSALSSILFGFILNGDLVNLSNDFASESEIRIETTDENNYFVDEDDFITFLNDEEVDLLADEIDLFIENENTYVVEITTNYNALDSRNDLEDALVTRFGENSPEISNYLLVFEGSSLDATFVSFQSMAIGMGVTLLAVGIYLLLRYKYTYSLTLVATTFFNIIFLLIISNLFRIPLGRSLSLGLVALIFFSTSSMVIIFDRVREFIKSKRKVYISNDERKEALIKALDANFSRFISSAFIMISILLAYMLLASEDVLFFNLQFIIAIVISIASSMLVAPRLWLLFEKRKDTRKRKVKTKHKKVERFKELEEKTFAGIND